MLQIVNTFNENILLMKTEDQPFTVEASFIRGQLDEQSVDPFDSLCKKCELKWKDQKCKSGNAVKTICIDDECKNSIFICHTQNCKGCYDDHKICKRVPLSSFSQLLKEMGDYQKKFFKKIYQIDEQIIKKIHQSRQQLVTMISVGSLEQTYAKPLQILSGQQKLQNLYGTHFAKLYTQLRKKYKETNQHQSNLESLFSKRSHEMIDANIKIKKTIFSDFLKGGNSNIPGQPQQVYVIQSPLLTICLNQLYMNTPAFYQQKRYNQFGYLEYPNAQKQAFNKQNMTFLMTELGNPKTCQFLYRASEHAFQAKPFHDRCDGKANTLTIIRTEFRKTIFAYAAQPWNSTGGYVNDTTGKSCIVWLDPRKKLTLASAGHSILGNPSHGPIFGSGNDLYLNNGGTGSTNFPSGYNNGLGGASQINYTLMCGNPSSNSFKVLEYEIYQLGF